MTKKTQATPTGKPTSARLLPNRPADKEDNTRPTKEVFAEAAAQLPATAVETAKQIEHPALLAKEKDAARPKAVQNGRLLATYTGLGLERDKDNEKLVHLDFSFPLEDAHNGFIPDKAKHAWTYLKESGDKLVQVRGIPPCTLDVFIDPKETKPMLHLVGATFSKAVVSIVEEVGKGKAKEVTRFAFRLLVDRDIEVIDFAAWNDGQEFWIVTEETQKSLLKNIEKKRKRAVQKS